VFVYQLSFEQFGILYTKRYRHQKRVTPGHLHYFIIVNIVVVNCFAKQEGLNSTTFCNNKCGSFKILLATTVARVATF